MSCKSWSSTVASSRAGARVYKHPCPCDCFGYKTLIDVSILTILTKTIDIHETKKLTQGQSHKVKGQGLIHNYKKTVWAKNHEWKIGS